MKGYTKSFRIPFLLFLTAILLPGISSCDFRSPPEIHRFAGQTMGTTYHVSTVGLPAGMDYEQVEQVVDGSLQEINRLMSTYTEESEVSRFGRLAPEQWFELSVHTYSVIKASQRLSQYSGGAFDITVGPVVSLWGFGPQYTLDKVPSQLQIDQAKALTGFEYLQVDLEAYRIKKARPLRVDLSAIAKGYAVDEVVRALKRHGLDAGLVEVGGEVRGFGRKPNDKAWKIAIERPVEGLRAIDKTVLLLDKAVATSGDYRNYFEQDGVRYSHTIDPVSGYPIRHKLASVSVIHDSAMYADGWATSLMVLGAEKGFQLAEEHGIAAYFIVRKGDSFEERQTEMFKPYLN